MKIEEAIEVLERVSNEIANTPIPLEKAVERTVAITQLLTFVKETSEMLEEADEIKVRDKVIYRTVRHEPSRTQFPEWRLYGMADCGSFSSAPAAFKSLKDQSGGQGEL